MCVCVCAPAASKIGKPETIFMADATHSLFKGLLGVVLAINVDSMLNP